MCAESCKWWIWRWKDSLFQAKEPCHSGRQQLKSQLSVLDERIRDNPFENITDSDVEDAVDDLNIVDASDDENDIDIRFENIYCSFV